MTYRFLILLILTAFLQKATAQPGNLVPNPGFEDRLTCIWNDGTLTDCPPWFRPTAGTPDVFHVCTVVNEDPCPYPEPANWNLWGFGVPTNFLGCQEPHSGNGYAGGFYFNPGVAPLNEGREYLAVQLLTPMIEGQQYLVRYYVSLAERSTHAIWALQIAFLYEPYFNLSSPTFIPVETSHTHYTGNFVTSKDDWMEVNGIYTAQGGERYLYMGNFQANIDTESIDVMNGQNTFGHYINSAYYYVDDVYVGTELLSIPKCSSLEFNLWPNPVLNELSIKVNRPCVITIYNALGAICVPAMNLYSEMSYNVAEWSSGVYLIKVQDAHNAEVHRFIKR